LLKVLPDLSVVVPVCDEERIIEQKTVELLDYLKHANCGFELVFVENGSSDRTPEILRSLSESSHVRVERIPKRDYSTSVAHGILSAKGDLIITMGIDFTDLTVIHRCIKALNDSDIVICSKNIGIDQRPLIRHFANRTYKILVRALFGIKFSDVEGYHGMQRKSVQDIVPLINAKVHLFNLWLLLYARRLGLTVKEVPLFVKEVRPSRFSQGPKLAYLALLTLVEFAKLKGKGF